MAIVVTGLLRIELTQKRQEYNLMVESRTEEGSMFEEQIQYPLDFSELEN